MKTNTWVFNNLTYLPYMTRAQWGSNPLANDSGGKVFHSGGRQWKTECDTATTGYGGCRSYILSLGVVHAVRNPDGTWRYYRADTWVFNNMVRFKL